MILHIETATKVCSVAVSANGELKSLVELRSDGYTHAENVTVFIQQALKEAECKMEDLLAVSVAAGPGSYTGLRIGVSTAKGLCYALGIPLISVDALVSIAIQLRNEYPNHFICPMIDARRMEVFSAIYDHQLNVVKSISADVLTEQSYSEFTPLVIAGDGAEKVQEFWKGRTEVVFCTDVLSSAKGQVQFAWEKFQNQNFEDVAYFEPFYLKDFKMGGK
jgi:tRNA threonylcarbamoyladenosine biosynthesis protein TsaB